MQLVRGAVDLIFIEGSLNIHIGRTSHTRHISIPDRGFRRVLGAEVGGAGCRAPLSGIP